MAEITLGGNVIHTIGDLPAVGTKAADFKLVKDDLSVATLADYKGKKIVMNIFPSLDTGTCAASVRRFNAEASKLDNTVVLCISRDLPFVSGNIFRMKINPANEIAPYNQNVPDAFNVLFRIGNV